MDFEFSFIFLSLISIFRLFELFSVRKIVCLRQTMIIICLNGTFLIFFSFLFNEVSVCVYVCRVGGINRCERETEFTAKLLICKSFIKWTSAWMKILEPCAVYFILLLWCLTFRMYDKFNFQTVAIYFAFENEEEIRSNVIYGLHIYIYYNSVDWVSATPTVSNLNAMTLSFFSALVLHASYTLYFIFQYDCVSVNIIRIWSRKPISQTQVPHSNVSFSVAYTVCEIADI